MTHPSSTHSNGRSPRPAANRRRRPTPGRKSVSRRTALIAGAGAAVAVVGGGAFLAIDRGLLGDEPDQPSIAVLALQESERRSVPGIFFRRPDRRSAGGAGPLECAAGVGGHLVRAGGRGAGRCPVDREGAWASVTCSAVRSESREILFRIATELTDGKTGFSLWSTTVDRQAQRHFRPAGRDRAHGGRRTFDPDCNRRAGPGRDARTPKPTTII